MDYETHRHRRHPHPYKPPACLEHFFVVTPISNSARFKRRYELYWRFAEMIEHTGVKLITVEQAFGDRSFMVTESDNPLHVQVRSHEELWLKENMINLGIRRAFDVDPLVGQIAWIDADCFPMYPCVMWLEETWQALQHYEFVQMWEYLINFGPNNEPISQPQVSFMATYDAAGRTVPEGKNVKHTLSGHSGYMALGRPGLAWAANVSAIDQVGGLIDKCILGSGDWHMAHGLVGAMKQFTGEFSKLSKYSQYLLDWQDKAEKWIKRDVGFVPTTVGHWFHGDKENRQYGTRGQILIRNGYDPYTDVKPNVQGLLQLETYTHRQIKLRDQIRSYFKSRKEDSNTVNRSK